MRFKRLLFLLMNARLLLLAFAVCGNGKDTVPSWLDTIPPTVRIEPSQRRHRSLFHVTLSAGEPAQLWLSRQRPDRMQRYRQPVSITRDGTYRFYFYGEDDFGNRSQVDSIVYVLDARPPELTVAPAPGTYRKNATILLGSNEPCSYFFIADRKDTVGRRVADTIALVEPLEGFFMAVDSAGNRTLSEKVRYTVDTSRISLTIAPPGGIYRVPQMVTVTVAPGNEAYVSFDPLAPPEWFTRYTVPLRLPHGLTIVRYFSRTPSGATSPIGRVSYVVDTIPPRLHAEAVRGEAADTLYLRCKEQATVRYTVDGSVPNESSLHYTVPLCIAHTGISRIRAKAWDRAGNVSDPLFWEYKYDHTPPAVSADPVGGTFRIPVTVLLTADEPAKILYTLNGTPVCSTAFLYSTDGIAITRQGLTELRYRGIDAAENGSDERSERYFIDTKPPDIRARIQGDIASNKFQVSLLSDERITVYYTVNEGAPTTRSPVYRGPVTMKSGDVISYFGVDSVGNATRIITMDDLNRPMVEARPPAGLYNRRLRIVFDQTADGKVWWRLLPDTLFRSGPDTVIIDREGMHTFEYFLQLPGGSRSAIRRHEYFLDWTPPQVTVQVQRGAADSAVIFFDANENASIYYTADGTNPLFSASTKTAGNKFQRASDRISLKRDPKGRLAWYAEDAAGNQGVLSILDVFHPRVIPNVPAGPDRVHDRILSITLQSQEGTVIHYQRHGRTPDLQSPVFSEPLTLSSSDTIVAFVVDASGYRGAPESFIYLIDLPPSPQFVTAPDTIHAGTAVNFDATGTLDRESPIQRLKFRWDFNDDGIFDTDSGFFPRVSHVFLKAGRYTVVLQAIDQRDRRAVFRKKVAVLQRCPADMVAAFDGRGTAFCIDRYEWPNRKGEKPLVNVSWVEAKMFCLDAGKRLCRRDEWISACNNNARSMYPYGDRYDPQRCATEEKAVVKSGVKEACVYAGIADMVGNAWEWVEEKQNDYVRALGGSYRYGKDAHCLLKFEGTVATRSNETGFRCCK
ncbi:MAG: chitobiase/beta-hexosaminidase C-terminal domain-containing protein [Chitinispirillaceae bacterium]|nr:chitobiase/beta-hexosaminidase C-terminal domain-containing protein [Chitinispirillaceae bacterium]